MAITTPDIGDSNWGGPLNAALTDLDTRTTALEDKFVAVPTLPNSSGIEGQIAYSGTHLYVCVDLNTWRRVELTSWS